MFNMDIRTILFTKRITHNRLAYELGVCDETLCRWLRRPLPEEKRRLIMSAIDQLTSKAG